MDKKVLLLSALLFAILTPPVFAHDVSTSESAKPEIVKERPQNTKDRLMKLKEAFQAQKEDSKGKQKEKMEAMRAEFKTKREEFKLKLSELKDTRKKTIVENVDLKLSTINKNATQRMNSSIEKLERILEKLVLKAETMKSEGIDTTNAEAAVLEARTAIQAAKDAVATQAAKEYVASITTEETLKSTVGEAMTRLRKDLNSTHDSVKTAKQKVIDVARLLGKTKGVTPTVSPSI